MDLEILQDQVSEAVGFDAFKGSGTPKRRGTEEVGIHAVFSRTGLAAGPEENFLFHKTA